eukprot:3844095-Pleurochrysis_carterae.AAC.2
MPCRALLCSCGEDSGANIKEEKGCISADTQATGPAWTVPDGVRTRACAETAAERDVTAPPALTSETKTPATCLRSEVPKPNLGSPSAEFDWYAPGPGFAALFFSYVKRSAVPKAHVGAEAFRASGWAPIEFFSEYALGPGGAPVDDNAACSCGHRQRAKVLSRLLREMACKPSKKGSN